MQNYRHGYHKGNYLCQAISNLQMIVTYTFFILNMILFSYYFLEEDKDF